MHNQIGHIGQELIKFVLVSWRDVATSLLKLFIVQIIHGYIKLVQSVNGLIFHVAVLCHILVGI